MNFTQSSAVACVTFPKFESRSVIQSTLSSTSKYQEEQVHKELSYTGQKGSNETRMLFLGGLHGHMNEV